MKHSKSPKPFTSVIANDYKNKQLTVVGLVFYSKHNVKINEVKDFEFNILKNIKQNKQKIW